MPDLESRPLPDPGGTPVPPGGGTPFAPLTATPRRLMDRIRRRQPPANAFVELNNLLAGAAQPREVTEAHVREICRTYGFDVRTTFAARCRQLYHDYLTWCLTDRMLSDEELASLRHLADLLRLDATTTSAVQRTVTRRIYLRSVEDVLEDGTVSTDERTFLARLSEQLDIPAVTADNILEIRQRQLETRNPRNR